MTMLLLIVEVLLVSIVIFISWRFYFLRNPKRKIPKGNHIVSPADGAVLYIKRVSNGEVPMALKKKNKILLTEITGYLKYKNTSGYLVGIFMTPFSVHRNRIPVSGEIEYKKYQPKPNNLTMVQTTTDVLFKRKSFVDYEYYLTNERLTTFIKTRFGTISVTQIADRWIRKIVSWVEEGDKVIMGQQFGMIRFGSQCDIFIPDGFKLDFNVKEGEYIYAGKTILATYTNK